MELCAATLTSVQPCQVRRSPDTTAPPTVIAPIQTEVTIAHAYQDSLAMVSPAKVKLFHFHSEQIISKTEIIEIDHQLFYLF